MKFNFYLIIKLKILTVNEAKTMETHDLRKLQANVLTYGLCSCFDYLVGVM